MALDWNTVKHTNSRSMSYKRVRPPPRQRKTPSLPVSQFTPKPLTPKQLPPDLADEYTESEFIGNDGKK